MGVGLSYLLAILAIIVIVQITFFYILVYDNVPQSMKTFISIDSTLFIVLGLEYLKSYLLGVPRPVFQELVCVFSYIVLQMFYIRWKLKK